MKNNNKLVKIVAIAAISTLCAVLLLDVVIQDGESKVNKLSSSEITNQDKNAEAVEDRDIPQISPGDIDGYSFVRNDPGPTQGSIIHVFKKN